MSWHELRKSIPTAAALNHCFICLKIGLHIKKLTLNLSKQDTVTYKVKLETKKKQQCNADKVKCQINVMKKKSNRIQRKEGHNK